MVFISKYHIGTRWRINLIKSQLDLTKKDRVLDAGCGEGYIAHSISKKVKTVQAVDFSKEVIKFNKSFETAKLKFDYLDLNNLDKKYKKNSFDKIICMDVLEHAHGFKKIMKNFNLVLKNKGVLLATIPVFDDHGHFEYNDFNFLKLFFKEQGFNIKKMVYMQMPFFTKLIHKFITNLRQVAGMEQKEVDSFDETLSFELRKKPSLTFRIYQVFFSVIYLFHYFDFKTYRNGEDFILLVLEKEIFNK